MPNICSKIADPIKRRRCNERMKSEQGSSPEEAVKQKSKKGSARIPGKY